MLKFYLISTDHLEDRIWFKDDKDFVVAMNYVAVSTAANPRVLVICFILMSNHVHFVLSGDRAECEKFMWMFKQLYSSYLRHRYGISNFLHRNGLDVREVRVEDEGLKRAIAYVQMNCVAARICLQPTQYAWGTGGCFFDDRKPIGTPIGSMSLRKRNTLLKSRKNIPADWVVSPGGYVLPESYVQVKFVESLFRTPASLEFFQQKSSKVRQMGEEEGGTSFRDQTISGAVADYCYTTFQKRNLQELTEPETRRLVREFRRRFSADVFQLARVLGLPRDRIVGYLDDFQG